VAAGRHPSPAPLVLADAHRVRVTADVLVANRRLARPEAPGVTVLELGAGGETVSGAPGDLLLERELLLLATGRERAPALRRMLLEPPGPDCPASLLRAHPELTVLCDREAAAELPPRGEDDHVCVVLGHREPGLSVEHRISHESLGRVHRAEWVARREPTLATILTGYTSTGGLSEAEQMLAAWRVPDVPALLEVAGRNTAENASRSLPIVLALGGVRRVTIATSAWHLRAPYHFAAWRRYGLAVDFAFDLHGDWPRMLANELQGLSRAPGERRRALAAMTLPGA
jgi:hypothetical protein